MSHPVDYDAPLTDPPTCPHGRWFACSECSGYVTPPAQGDETA